MKKIIITPMAMGLLLSSISHAQSTLAANGLLTLLPTKSQASKNSHNYVSGKLVDVVFGDNAKVTIQPNAGNQIVILVTATAKYNMDSGTSNLTGFATKYSNQTVYVDYAKDGSNKVLVELWNSTAWNSFTNRHSGTNGAYITEINNAFIVQGSNRYRINDATVFRKGGKELKNGRMFANGHMAFVKGEIQNGEPVALVVADTQTAADGSASAGNTRPEAGSGPTRPPSAGSSAARPSSAGSKGTPKSQKGGTIPAAPTKPEKGGKKTGKGAAPAGADPKQGGTAENPAAPSKAPKNLRPKSKGTTNSPSERTATTYALCFQFRFVNTADPVPNKDAITEMARAAGATDQTVEFFGSLKFDGTKFWEIERKDANNYKKKKGDTLDLRMISSLPTSQGAHGFLYIKNNTVRIVGTAYDDDDMTSDDHLANVNKLLDLPTLDGKGWTKVMNEYDAAELWVKVQKVNRQ